MMAPSPPNPPTDPVQLRALLESFKRLETGDRDEVVLVTGVERSGKSGLSFCVANYVDPDFDVETQIAWTAEDYLRQAVKLAPSKPIWLDEAIQGGFSRDAMSEPNKALARFLTVAGHRNLLHLICWPNLRFADPILKEHRCRYNLHVRRRYKDHALANARELRDGEGNVHYEPKTLFPFTYPKPTGRKWELYRQLKREFTERVGLGVEDQEAERGQALERMRRDVEPLLEDLVDVAEA